MDKKINQAVIRIPCNLQEFFFYWVKFLKPLHNLTEREIQVAAELLLERYEISKTLAKEFKNTYPNLSNLFELFGFTDRAISFVKDP